MKFQKLSLIGVNLSLSSLMLAFLFIPVMASHGPEGGGGEIVLNPVDTNILYRVGNGIHKSTNGGENWQRIDGPMNFEIYQLLLDSINPSVIYLRGRLNQIRGIYKSTDDGISWRFIFELGDISWSAIDPINPEILYVVKGGEGIFKTIDGGDTWELKLESPGLNSIAIHSVETNTIYVGGNGVRKSTDGGKSWTLVGLEGRSAFGIVLDPVDVNTLYARVIYPGIGQRMARSTDGGVNWEQLPTDIKGWLAIDPEDTRVLYISGDRDDGQRIIEFGIYKSTDGGNNWGRVSELLPLYNVLIDPNDTRIVYVGSSEGTAKSTDGGESWTIYSRGFVATNIQRVLVAASDTNRIYASPGGRFISRSMDGGESWSQMRLVESDVRAIDPSNPDTIYGAGFGQESGLRKSTDAGESWVTILREPNHGPIAIDPINPDTLYAATHCGISTCDLHKSTDGGVNWTRIATLADIESLAIDPQDSQTVYAVTTNGVWKSHDGGQRWGYSGLRESLVGWIVIDPNDPSLIYVGGLSGIFKSEDAGANWSQVTEFWAGTFAIDAKDRNIFYVGRAFGAGGIYKSTDGGQTWEPRNQGLTNTTINDLTVAPDTGRIYAATGGAGVWFSDDGAETWQ